MKTTTIKIKIEKPFGNLFRETTALIVKNNADKFLLGAKPAFYPPLITRVLGGGIKEGESIVQAAQRELEEELNIKLSYKELNHIETLEVKAIDNENKSYNSKVHFVLVIPTIEEYKAGDDVKYINEFSKSELETLVETYTKLPGTLWYKGEEGEFCWQDYGKMYSKVHSIALNIAYAD